MSNAESEPLSDSLVAANGIDNKRVALQESTVKLVLLQGDQDGDFLNGSATVQETNSDIRRIEGSRRTWLSELYDEQQIGEIEKLTETEFGHFVAAICEKYQSLLFNRGQSGAGRRLSMNLFDFMNGGQVEEIGKSYGLEADDVLIGLARMAVRLKKTSPQELSSLVELSVGSLESIESSRQKLVGESLPYKTLSYLPDDYMQRVEELAQNSNTFDMSDVISHVVGESKKIPGADFHKLNRALEACLRKGVMKVESRGGKRVFKKYKEQFISETVILDDPEATNGALAQQSNLEDMMLESLGSPRAVIGKPPRRRTQRKAARYK